MTSRSEKSLWSAVCVCALLLTSLLTPLGRMRLAGSSVSSLFQRRQANGSAIGMDWRSFGGTWDITDAGIRDDSEDRGAKLISYRPPLKDATIEGNIMLRSFSGYASDAGFLLRTNREEEGVYAYYGYYAMLHRVKDHPAVFAIGRAGQGPEYLAVTQLPSELNTGVWYHMKFSAVGCKFAAALWSLDDSRKAELLQAGDPNCITEGRAGLTSSHAGGEWRDVAIRSAKRSDLPAPQSPFSVSPPAAAVGVVTSDPQESAIRPEPEQVESIGKATLWALIAPRVVTVTGQVNLLYPEIVIQDPSGGITIHTATYGMLKIGDEVSVTGFASATAGGPALNNASVHVLWEGQPGPANSVTASRLATAEYDGEYVEIEGTLIGRQVLSDDLVRLKFSAEPQRFEALIPRERDSEQTQAIQFGSSVRLRGVATRDTHFLDDGVAFGVLVRSADEVRVTSGPPWWTPRNLLLLACLLTITVVAVGLVYRRVEKAKLLAVAHERERLAYEMHDTLAQSVAGIGFQLEAIRATLPSDQIQLRKQLSLAQDLVRHSHAEARTSIEMLHPQQMQRLGLLPGLKKCAQRLVGSSSITVETETHGNHRQVTMRVTDALFRIGQEAIANSVRHANPTRLWIMLVYQERQLVFSVRDNGCGFQGESDGQTLGLMSMQRRAQDIAAEFLISSRPGEGTTVSISVPLPRYSLSPVWQPKPSRNA